MLLAANAEYNLEIAGAGMQRSVLFRGNSNNNESTHSISLTERRLSFSGLIASNNRVNHLVRFVYFFNATALLIWMLFIAVSQDNGHYRCNTISVLFDEEIWENAYVKLGNGIIDKERLLIYSHFNGVYKGNVSYSSNWIICS